MNFGLCSSGAAELHQSLIHESIRQRCAAMRCYDSYVRASTSMMTAVRRLHLRFASIISSGSPLKYCAAVRSYALLFDTSAPLCFVL